MIVKARPMKAGGVGLVVCAPGEATHIALNFPGPSGIIIVRVFLACQPKPGPGSWLWNGCTASPTLKPSIRTRGESFLCHAWVTAGRVTFLPDCTHEFKGRTVELLDTDLLR